MLSRPVFVKLRPQFWHKVYLFYYVAQFKSFSQAAAYLKCSVSALWRAIHRLEARCPSPLLKRTTRHLEITPLGQALIPSIEAMLPHFERLETLLNQKGSSSEGRPLS